MIEKFERLEEPKQKKDHVESILFSIIFLFIIILAGLWYYQNQVMSKADYIRKNEIKLLDKKQKELEDEINRVLQENARLKEERNSASILIKK